MKDKGRRTDVATKFEKLYYDTKSPAGFAGIEALSKKIGTPKKTAELWLQKQDTYTLHKPRRVRFRRRKVLVAGLNYLWQSDLVEVGKLAKYNDGVRYLLTIIDCLSRKARVYPLKDKTGKSIVQAFQNIKGTLPFSLQTDNGKEFVNKQFQTWLNEHNVGFYTSKNFDMKATLIERFNRSLLSRLWKYLTYSGGSRYIDVLNDIVSAYNNRVHRSIGMAPAKVKATDAFKIWQRLHGELNDVKPPKIKVGDFVRLSKLRKQFQKGYRQQWTVEKFVVVRVFTTTPATFKLQDMTGEDIQGVFYEPELQRVTHERDGVYRIDKIVAKDKRRVLVKWLGFPDKFNSWVLKKDLLTNYKG